MREWCLVCAKTNLKVFEWKLEVFARGLCSLPNIYSINLLTPSNLYLHISGIIHTFVQLLSRVTTLKLIFEIVSLEFLLPTFKTASESAKMPSEDPNLTPTVLHVQNRNCKFLWNSRNLCSETLFSVGHISLNMCRILMKSWWWKRSISVVFEVFDGILMSSLRKG